MTPREVRDDGGLRPSSRSGAQRRGREGSSKIVLVVTQMRDESRGPQSDGPAAP